MVRRAQVKQWGGHADIQCMSRHLRLGAPVLAVLLALFFAKVQWEFGTALEPGNARLAQALFSIIIGLVLQLGLFLLPWAVTRGRGARVLIATLMLPAGLTMVTRSGRGSPGP